MPFVKLDCGILESSLWDALPDRHLFITALLMAKPHTLDAPAAQLAIRSLDRTGWTVPPGEYGLVEAAGIGIIRRAGVDREAGLDGLERLGSPDSESKSGEYDGRRLVRVDGGFLVLNFRRYRDKDHGNAERCRRYRAKLATCHVDVSRTRVDMQAEAEAESTSKDFVAGGGSRGSATEEVKSEVQTDAQEQSKPARRALARPTEADAEWIATLRSDTAYAGLDVDREIAKCQRWCEANHKQPPSRRRIVNWLNRAERPVQTSSTSSTPQELPLWRRIELWRQRSQALTEQLRSGPAAKAGPERDKLLAEKRDVDAKIADAAKAV